MDETASLPERTDGRRWASGSKETMTQVVGEHLRRQIISGELKPGERIRQEDLAEACGTSRIPVREALQRLEAEGLVTMVPHAGARVASMSIDDVHEVYLIRERLEPVAVELSVPQLTGADIAELRALVDAMDEASQAADVRKWIDLNRSFHMLAMSKAAVPRLLRMTEDMWNASQAFRHLNTFLPGRTAVAQLEHRLLVVAIESGDASWASDVVAMHIRRTRRELESRSDLLDLSPFGDPDGSARRRHLG